MSILDELRYPRRWYTKLITVLLALIFFAGLSTVVIAGVLTYESVHALIEGTHPETSLLAILTAAEARADGLSPLRPMAEDNPQTGEKFAFLPQPLLAEGKVRYSMAIELSDAAGKLVFRQAAKEQEARASLGGDSVPAYAYLSVGLDTTPGDYRMKVVVKDLASGREQSLNRDLKVLAKDFALVRTTVSMDPEAHFCDSTFSCGQGVWVHTSAVGFCVADRDVISQLVA